MGKKGLVANAKSNNSKLIIAMANNNNKITEKKKKHISMYTWAKSLGI